MSVVECESGNGHGLNFSTAGYVIGTSGDEPTTVPVDPVATAAADPSALRGDPGVFPAGRGNDPRPDGAQDAVRRSAERYADWVGGRYDHLT